MLETGSNLKHLIWMLVSILIIACISSDNGQAESQAEEKLKQTIEINPNDAQAHYQLGLLYDSESRYELAKTHLKKAIEIKQDYAEAYFALGLSLNRLGEYRSAMDSFQMAVKYKPDYWPEAFNEIGAAYREIAYREKDGKKSIEMSLVNFLKASDRCNDINSSLCLSIAQNVVTTYIDLYAMSPNHNKVEKAYLRSAIDFAKKALTPANKTNHAHQYAMLQYSLGEVYVLVGGSENKKAESAYNEALSLLDQKTYPVEHNMVLNSMQKLRSEAKNDSSFAAERNNKGEHNEKEIVIQFISEEGKPLRDAMISLLELRGDEFIKAHFRDKPIGENGMITLPTTLLELPKGSELFIRTKDGFYSHAVQIKDLSISDSYVKIVVPKTGIISATIIKYTNNIKQPLVVPVLRLNENGSYEEFTGIGIGLSIGYKFTIPGLPTGIYKIQIKKSYDDLNVYYEKDDIKVVAGKSTDIGKIELVAP